MQYFYDNGQPVEPVNYYGVILSSGDTLQFISGDIDSQGLVPRSRLECESYMIGKFTTLKVVSYIRAKGVGSTEVRNGLGSITKEQYQKLVATYWNDHNEQPNTR